MPDDRRCEPAQTFPRPGCQEAGGISNKDRVGGVSSEVIESELIGRCNGDVSRVHEAPVTDCGKTVLWIVETREAELIGVETSEDSVQPAATIRAARFRQQDALIDGAGTAVDGNRTFSICIQIGFVDECGGDVVELIARFAPQARMDDDDVVVVGEVE